MSFKTKRTHHKDFGGRSTELVVALYKLTHFSRNGPTVIQREAAIERNAYQQSLEEGLAPLPLTRESVRYWSDFNRVYFHPRSIVQLNEYELGSSLMPFETWNVGEDLFSLLDKEHDIIDRDLRPFVEEADQMQAIQLMTSVDDAWGGFGCRYMDRLRDEYGKTAIWIWGLEDGIRGIPRVSNFLFHGQAVDPMVFNQRYEKPRTYLYAAY